VAHAKWPYLVPGRAERAHDVVFGFPRVDFLLAVPLDRGRRHPVRVHEHKDAQAFHSAIHLRRDGPNSACMVLAVNSTVKSIRSWRSEPTARRLCSQQRVIMSSSTASRVSWFSPVQRETNFRILARWRLINTEAGCERRCRGSAENSR